MKVFFGFFYIKNQQFYPLPTSKTLHSQLYTLSGRSGKAVGLSAISLLAFCFLLAQKKSVVC